MHNSNLFDIGAPATVPLRLAPAHHDGGPAAESMAALAAEPSATVSTPPWALAIRHEGQRHPHDIFRIPRTHPWVNRWLFQRPQDDGEAFAEIALQNTSSYSETVYRVIQPDGSCYQGPAINNTTTLSPRPEPYDREVHAHHVPLYTSHYSEMSGTTFPSTHEHSISSSSDGASTHIHIYNSQSECLLSEASDTSAFNLQPGRLPTKPLVCQSPSSMSHVWGPFTPRNPSQHSPNPPKPRNTPSTSSSMELPLLEASLATHWFLCPYQSINGITIGILYCQIVYDKLDRKMTVQSVDQPFGRFAMDENTGEIVYVCFQDETLLVGWVQSVSSCERILESFILRTPKHDGDTPDLGNFVIRNSWYERRKCDICGVHASDGSLPRPCVGGPIRSRRKKNVEFSGFHSRTGRFRGNYFGIVMKSRYFEGRIITEAVRIVSAVRKPPPCVDQDFRAVLRKSGMKWHLPTNSSDMQSCSILRQLGLDPTSSARYLFVGRPDIIRAVQETSLFSYSAASAVLSDMVYGMDRMSIQGSKAGEGMVVPSVVRRRGDRGIHDQLYSNGAYDLDEENGPVRRRRNTDMDELDPVTVARKRRNRIAAERANERRKKLLAEAVEELGQKKRAIPGLRERQERLRRENLELRRLLDVTSGLEK